MVVSQIDGYLAGIMVCPDLIAQRMAAAHLKHGQRQ